MSIGTLLGGLVGDLRFVGLLGLSSTLLAIGLVYLTKGPPVIPRGEARRSVLPRAAVLPGGTFALASVGYAAMVGFVVVHLEARDVNGTIALVTFTVTVLVGRFVAVPMALRIGLARALPGALVLSATGLLMVGLGTGLPVALAGSMVVAIGYCVLWPVLGALVAGRVRGDQRGAALGALAASYDVAIGVSSIPFGLLVAGAGTEWIFVAAAASSLVAGGAGIVLGRGAPPRVVAGPDPIVSAGDPG
jgi:predicted MFS family arabinose efflux permease